MEDKFVYSYSSKQQQEIENIRNKYIPKKESKLDELRQLDASVTKKGTIISITFGVISSLVLGIGMYFSMEIKNMMLIPGIVVGLIGIVGIGFAYPLYSSITKRERKKVADKIIELSDELIK